MYDALQLLGVLCSLAVGLALLVVPIVVLILLVRTRQRLAVLESEVKRLGKSAAATPRSVSDDEPLAAVLLDDDGPAARRGFAVPVGID